jgi:hypothetical protein
VRESKAECRQRQRGRGAERQGGREADRRQGDRETERRQGDREAEAG